MTRVPPPKAPTTQAPRTAQRPSTPQRASTPQRPGAPRTARPQQAQRPKTPKPPAGSHASPAHVEESPESLALGEHKPEPEVTHEEMAEEAAEKAHEAWAPDVHEDKETKAHAEELLKEAERSEGQKEDPLFSQKFSQKPKDPKQSAPVLKKPSDGFEQKQQLGKLKASLGGLGGLGSKESQEVQKSTATTAAQSVAAAAKAGEAARADKPQDAMTVLHNAREPGIYFVEDQHREGHSEEQEDPELREAVEETIRLLFGVPGILRVGPGKGDDGAPVIVVVAGKGFGQASMKSVPERVHRFATLLALPYELLPLRRERL